MSHHRFIHGDAIEAMRTLSAENVHCVVTSPPYWGLRDYGAAGQIGLEQSPEDYVSRLVAVFSEVRRVLRGDGVLWLNLGDSYAAGGKGGGGSFMAERRDAAWQHRSEINGWRSAPEGYKAKDLVGIPWMVAFALRADGWYLRSETIWHKPNPMPESVTDRPTKAHEHVFLLSKSPRYFYDAVAIREPYAPSSRPDEIYTGMATKAYEGTKAQNPSDTKRRVLESMRRNGGSSKRDVWTVATAPFHGAHFAVFPPKLVEPMILAGTSSGGCCPKCGAPYERQMEQTGHINQRETAHVPGNTTTKQDSTGWAPMRVPTDNWLPTCTCNAGPPIPCTVLDPFGGSGTVSMVAKQFGRDSVYIDLNRKYVDMAVKRVGFDNPTLGFDTYEVVA